MDGSALSVRALGDGPLRAILWLLTWRDVEMHVPPRQGVRGPDGLSERLRTINCYLSRILQRCDAPSQGTLTVRCRQEPDGALVLLNAVVMAAGGGSAMDIPREAM